MFLIGEITMKIDKLLISSAMLAAMCEQVGVDNLKMLESFIIVCLVDMCEPGAEVPKGDILRTLDQRFALRAMPMAVLDKILFRMSQNGSHIVRERKAEKGGRKFELIRKPLEQARTFHEQEEYARRDTEDVVNALINWLHDNTTIKDQPSNVIQEYLGIFFESNGFDILFDPEELRGATTRNTDEVNYQIGRFILSTQETNSILFKKIVAIAQGMIVSSVIYVDTAPVSKSTAKRRLRDMNVYLDTTLLLYALGYKTLEQKNIADVLIDLLRNNGANLYVYPNHFSEIVEILNASKRVDAYKQSNGQMLESFIQKGYTALEIDGEIRNLKDNLEKMGIEVAPETQYTEMKGGSSTKENTYIDYNGLKSDLVKTIPQYGKHPRMLENDVLAIADVMVNRLGMKYRDIESCNAIFVTTNYKLVRKVNNFLHYPVESMYITPIISDTDLTTVLWIKYAMTLSKEISKLQLVEYARAALAPSPAVMEKFNDVTKRMTQKGVLSEDEAACMRYDAYARAEIVAMCGGNSARLDDTSVSAVWDRVKARLTTAETERANQATERANKAYATAQLSERMANEERMKASAETERANRADAEAERLDYLAKVEQAKTAESAKKLRGIELKGKTAIAELRKEAENEAERLAHILGRFAKTLVSIIVAAIMAVSGFATIKVGLSGSVNIVGVIALIVATIGAITLWFPAFDFSKRIGFVIYNKSFDKIYAAKLEKRQKEIDRIASIYGLAK